MGGLELIVVLGVTVLIGTTLGGRYSVAPPVLLITLGALIGLVPPFDHVVLEPQVVLLLFLPAILYRESLVVSLREIRANFLVIALLAVALVVLTMVAVAYAARLLGVDPAAAWVLGAVLAPTDAAAVAGLAKRMPRNILTTLRAESLINDGTALALFAVAVAVIAGGHFPGPAGLAGRFLGSAGGGIVAGLLVAGVVVVIRRRLDDPLRETGLSLLTPFAAFLLAESVHASGVLAVVVAGLLLSYAAPWLIRARTRVTTLAVWDVSTFMINGGLFVLLGTQVPRSLRAITSHSPMESLGIAAAVAAVVVVVRMGWVHLAIAALQGVDRRESRRERRFNARVRTAMGWAGFRGAVSLAAALAVPATTTAGTPVHERDLIIFVTVTVIVLTMLIQGTTLPALVTWARLTGDRARDEELRSARIRATQAGLAALPQLAAELGAPSDTVDRLRADYEETLADVRADDQGGGTAEEREIGRQLRLAVLDHKRREVTRLRDTRAIDDAVLRDVQAALDIEELRLLGPTTEE
ncbi:Na+/H+ antiporter [Micromonospora sp. NPDC050686]|uniref:Na+/H+ antiporter n=1 Tax=Micromonospora sp. NPDC050686 TaxID=3154631 RepID=UPI0033CD4643